MQVVWRVQCRWCGECSGGGVERNVDGVESAVQVVWRV